MDIQPDFSRFYKRLSSAELLVILENPGSYKVAALEEAKRELSSRGLPENEVANLKNELLENKLLMEERNRNGKNYKEGINKKRNSIIASFNPNQKDISKSEKSIRFITIGLSALFLIYLIKDFTTIQFFIRYMVNMPAEAVVVLLPIIMLPIALFLFWKRKPAGWRLLAIWLTYSILESTTSLLIPDDSGPLDYLVPSPSISGVLTNLVIVCGALLTICQNNIREEFTINKKNMTSILILTVVFSLLFSIVLAILSDV